MNTITARQTRIRNSFDAGEILSLQNPEYRTFLEDFFDRFLRSDLRDGDISQYPESAFQQPARARIVAKESGVMAGLTEIRYILNARGLPTESEYTDGDFVQRNDIVLTLSGKSGSILKLERSILNILQRLCGIASTTAAYVRKIENTGTFIAGTRKTLWGVLDKRAIQCGGGLTHRLNLHDAAMLKENHLAILRQSGGTAAVREAVQTIFTKHPNLKFIEIEVSSIPEFRRMLDIFISLGHPVQKVIMFDHFTPGTIKAMVSELQQNGHYDEVLLEASGNISLENLTDYAGSGVDVISAGAITHSVKGLDLSLLME